jgi:hypothetical protein
MGFPERAVEACYRDWSSGIVDESHVRDVLKCKRVDVSILEEFLRPTAQNEIRMAAARIQVEKGNIEEVVKLAVMTEDREFLLELLSILGKQEGALEVLEGLLISKDKLIRDAAVEMFRRAGKVEILFPLIFDEDYNVVKRIKRYINEER